MRINKRRIKKILLKGDLRAFNYLLIALLLITAFLFGVLYDKITTPKSLPSTSETSNNKNDLTKEDLAKIQSEVLRDKYVFKIKWGDLGKKMIEDGVIDKQKLAKAVTGTDKLPQNLDKYLTDNQNSIEVNQNNSQFWVDVLWGLGLANKNNILENGQMAQGGTQANFASTGGWTLGVSDPMQYYSKYQYLNLSNAQQKEVEEIAGSIYRPCCDNPTSFPDCNHGMAALGLIELMVSQNIAEDEIYKTVLAFNTYWFPQTYLNVAYYFKQNGRDYSKVSAKEILSKTFSSASGSQVITQKVGNLQWPALQSGGSCGA